MQRFLHCWKPVPFRDVLPFHWRSNPARLNTRQTLDGLTATMSASSQITRYTNRGSVWYPVPDLDRAPIMNEHLLHQAAEKVFLLRVGPLRHHFLEVGHQV